mmetsp:Transcript_48003/g.155697  ORF Transcript_48003/g.155697 Transcript_48003/m.155697 type:complete len:261 (+) Transcript_48003:2132-2914(+)
MAAVERRQSYPSSRWLGRCATRITTASSAAARRSARTTCCPPGLPRCAHRRHADSSSIAAPRSTRVDREVRAKPGLWTATHAAASPLIGSLHGSLSTATTPRSSGHSRPRCARRRPYTVTPPPPSGAAARRATRLPSDSRTSTLGSTVPSAPGATHCTSCVGSRAQTTLWCSSSTSTRRKSSLRSWSRSSTTRTRPPSSTSSTGSTSSPAHRCKALGGGTTCAGRRRAGRRCNRSTTRMLTLAACEGWAFAHTRGCEIRS